MDDERGAVLLLAQEEKVVTVSVRMHCTDHGEASELYLALQKGLDGGVSVGELFTALVTVEVRHEKPQR